jgi:TonB-linked SusC/RagA family outer membrane protein
VNADGFCLLRFHKKHGKRSFLRFMKIPFIPIILILCGLAFAGPSCAQEVLERKVSVNINGLTFEKALKALEAATNVKFVYSSSHLRLEEKVSVDAETKTLGQVLDELLSPLQVGYNLQDNNGYIVLTSYKEERDPHQSGIAEVSGENDVFLPTLSGKVSDQHGLDLQGVNVIIKGTVKGTVTDSHGNFNIGISGRKVTLVFSFIGYTTKEVIVNGQTMVSVTLEEEATSLNEVVITALGIKRLEKSVTYATQQVSGEELTRSRTDNLMNTLSGKIPGVTIFSSASGIGGSSKVILRGSRSFAQSNQPLYVIDGIPVTNSSNSNGQPNSPFGGPIDGGDGISNLNPDDIESISVLKGAAASALYGSQAANGVILITTRKGKESQVQVNFNSSLLVSAIAYKPEFQNNYGRTNAASGDSWGSEIQGSANDNVGNFFQTGFNGTNSISLSAGTETAQSYFSFSDMRAHGVIPGNSLIRNNIKLQQTAKFLNKRLTFDASVNYVSQEVDNTPALGLYFNPMTGLYLFPRGVDITPYKAQYEFADRTGYARQNWITSEDIQQNPWWIVNRNPNYSGRRRLLIAGSANYKLNDRISLQVRGNVDRNDDRYEQDLYSGTQATLSKANGQFMLNTQTLEQKYGDVLLVFGMPVRSSFEANGIIGASITDSRTTGTALGPGLGLTIPDLFLAQNIIGSNSINYAFAYPENRSQIQSVFGSLNISFREWMHLNFTGRNDWSSNLSFTPSVSYFYPSVGISAVLSEALMLPESVNYFKIIANYAQVGNTVPQYMTNPLNYLDNTGSVILNTIAPFGTLKPERTKTYEIGADARFFDDRLSLTLNYYRSNTYNQFVKVVPSSATGYSAGYVNAGNVQNAGIEFSTGYAVTDGRAFTWHVDVNGAHNTNKIVDVNSKNGIDKFVLTSNDNTSYQSVLAKGGSYGDIYGVTARRDDQGRIIVNPDGTPQLNNGFHYLGNSNCKLTLGCTNNIHYKKFTLSFLADGKFGGSVFSMTQAIMDQYGVSKETGEARDRGGVKVNAVNETGEPVTTVDPQKWYTSIGGRQGISELYVYSATVIRLREASLGYVTTPRNSVIKSLKISLTGRNLFYFYRKAPYDPEMIMSTGNGLSGVDIFNQPATRNIGLALNVTL